MSTMSERDIYRDKLQSQVSECVIMCSVCATVSFVSGLQELAVAAYEAWPWSPLPLTFPCEQIGSCPHHVLMCALSPQQG